ncbi:MAG: CDP-glucose 4,6-dehydratase [Thermodesulfobacteriota bacterium]|nr:CDP-glucose 4,6-dehydratase [Thermodesulfobacteriota bacterium]
MFGNVYRDRKVFVTGHTGFKGSWLCLWLKMLGAKVTGYSLPPHTEPNHCEILGLDMVGVEGDVREGSSLSRATEECAPDIVFHLAAQALVRPSYQRPAETFETNVMGTVNLLEACRDTPGVEAVVNVTSDKCYENREWDRGYRENDPMGGHDPYSASKGCSELVTASYRRSFFSGSGPLVASARAGNAVGGGDWSEDRIMPDLFRAAVNGETTLIRNPTYVRPWQHVLESLSGYLMLGAELWRGREEFARAWNFGPDSDSGLTVLDLAMLAGGHWTRIRHESVKECEAPHEAGLLTLDISEARGKLGWWPVWDAESAVRHTVDWYKAYYEEGKVLSREQIEKYVKDAGLGGLPWTRGNDEIS